MVVDDGTKEHDGQDTLRSERRSALRKYLTEPTLLEMPDKCIKPEEVKTTQKYNQQNQPRITAAN